MKNLLLPGALVLCAIPSLSFHGNDSPASGHTPTLETFTWSRGQKPIKMIREQEGFCFLSEIGGCFAGGGERVRVYVDDGWWWIHGRCMQRSLWATATCIRHAKPAPSRPAPSSHREGDG